MIPHLRAILRHPLTFALSLLLLLVVLGLSLPMSTRCGGRVWSGVILREPSGSMRAVGDWTSEYEQGSWINNPVYVGECLLSLWSGPRGTLAYTRDETAARFKQVSSQAITPLQARAVAIDFLTAWQKNFDTRGFTEAEIRSLAPAGAIRHIAPRPMGYVLNGLVALLAYMTLSSGYANYRRLWRWVNACHDPTRCRECGYSLVGLPERVRVCPECGEGILDVEEG